MSVGGRSVSLFTEAQEIKINLDNGGSVITTGDGTSFYQVSDYGQIVGWYITGYPSGSIVIDILKKFNSIPSVLDSITGSEKPTLSGGQLANDVDLTTWTNRNLIPGDVLGIAILSVTSLTNCVITLKVAKT